MPASPHHPDTHDDDAQALLLQLFLQQEGERHGVARALHNQVGQALSAIKMAAHLTLDEDDAEQRRQDLQDIIRTSDDTIAVLRDLHVALHPPQLDSIGLDAALRAEVERLSKGIEVQASLLPLPRTPDPGHALIAFRIAQSLMRKLATADAKHLRLALSGDTAADGDLRLELECAGASALPQVALLRALAAAAGGRLRQESIGTGGRWRLRLPYGPTPTSAGPA